MYDAKSVISEGKKTAIDYLKLNLNKTSEWCIKLYFFQPPNKQIYTKNT